MVLSSTRSTLANWTAGESVGATFTAVTYGQVPAPLTCTKLPDGGLLEPGSRAQVSWSEPAGAPADIGYQVTMSRNGANTTTLAPQKERFTNLSQGLLSALLGALLGSSGPIDIDVRTVQLIPASGNTYTVGWSAAQSTRITVNFGTLLSGSFGFTCRPV
ncbi:hypothetical protein D9V34_00910 [Mycetocola lacteus]|uniref:Uncharacterized protein n=1 Tax=Mycetocola lacteus TaxID=76637 RepID=A0A3L7ALH6_9MICO|nr:hypothetical protein [Mycetocola lacteus]RLP80805.1 hypothetical protein D9V34_13205 [Mycetocola lacteus]RLP84590.1 hypothetical protein D9V34_00910 [Mycetocola lacteus]